MGEIYVGKLFKYQTIQSALDGLDGSPTTLILADEEYREKVRINHPNVSILSKIRSRIVFGDFAKKIHADGSEYNTFRTPTLTVLAPHVVLQGLVIENDAGFGEAIGQAVALAVYADDFLAADCRLKARQDTLFLGPLPEDLRLRYAHFLPPQELLPLPDCRQTFQDCHISGDVDFIFGCGEATFDRCLIESLPRKEGQLSYVVAPAHAREQHRGFVFERCSFVGEASMNETVFLARPWRDYGLAKFQHCYIGAHIHPFGFDPWNDSGRDKTCRFFEIGSTGPGKEIATRVAWINQADRL